MLNKGISEPFENKNDDIDYPLNVHKRPSETYYSSYGIDFVKGVCMASPSSTLMSGDQSRQIITLQAMKNT